MSTIDTSPFADDVRAVAARYGVAEQDVVPVPVQGQVNWTAYLGDELVVRIPRTSRGSEQLLKEAAVIPVARDAGVPTPALVDVDSTLRLASSPYMVLERVRGTTLTEKTLDPAQRRRALASLGEVLAALHEVRRSRVGSVGAIPAPYTFSPTEVVERLVDAGEIGSGQSDWLLEQFSLLQPEGPSISDPVLLHRDVIPSNVMVDREGAVVALLDWGCAEWGSPARDLVGLQIRDLPDLLSGYRSALGGGSSNHDLGDGFALERDVLWFHLYLALARLLKDPSTSEDRNWAAPRSATLVDVLAFVAGAAGETWPSHLRRLAAR